VSLNGAGAAAGIIREVSVTESRANITERDRQLGYRCNCPVGLLGNGHKCPRTYYKTIAPYVRASVVLAPAVLCRSSRLTK
jgi:hypothetical protein